MTWATLFALAALANPDRLAEADALGQQALQRFSSGEHAEGLSLIGKAVAIRSDAGLSDDLNTGRMMVTLGQLQEQTGDLASALATYERILAIIHLHLGEDATAQADIRLYAARVLLAQGRPAEARIHLNRGIELAEPHLAPDDITLVNLLDLMAECCAAERDYEGARQRYQRIVDAYRESRSNDYGLAIGLGQIAWMYEREGQFPEALTHYKEQLAFVVETLGAESALASVVLNNSAIVHKELGDLGSAREAATESLRIAEWVWSPEDPRVATSLNTLAVVLDLQADFAAARPIHERALKIRTEQLGPDHPNVASSTMNLGYLLGKLGQREAELRMHTRAVAILEARAVPEDAQLANALLNLATSPLLAPEEARQHYDRALTIAEAAHGPHHPQVAKYLNSYGTFEFMVGNSEAGLDLYERSLEIKRAVHGDDHPEVAITMTNIGWRLHLKGDQQGAAEWIDDALAIYLSRTGEDGPNTIDSRFKLARIAAAAGDEDRARALFADTLPRQASHARSLIETLGEREALKVMHRYLEHLDAYMTAFDRPEDTAQVYSAVLAAKGAVGRLVIGRRRALEGGEDRTVRERRVELDEVRAKIARAVFDVPLSNQSDQRQDRIVELTATKDKLERTLATLSAGFRRGLVLEGATAKTICEALPPDTSLVDFKAYDGRYAAFVTDRDCDIRRVELGASAPMNEAIEMWRDVLGGSEVASRVERRGTAVAELLWHPIAPLVADSRRILIVPDGRITGVPFAAIPVSEDHYLIEDHVLSGLETAHDLLRWADAMDPTGGALFIGGVDFDSGLDSVREGAPVLAMRHAPCGDEPLPPLPGTATEVDRLTALWNAQKKVEPALVLTGQEPTEAAVGWSMPEQRIIHLATHGFFADAKCQSGLSGAAAGLNPMVLSGIALAGSNLRNTGTNREDGILTAEEVATLDLRGTQIVVLSACETGLGEIANGEGVLGLRRAFAAAGARTLVTSLWAVSDDATAELMEDFYHGMLRRKKPVGPTEALRDAQLAMLARSRKSGDADTNAWAAFVSAGDWR